MQCYDILKFASETAYKTYEDEGYILSKTWTVKEILDWTRDYFKGAGVERSRLEAEQLLAYTLDVDRIQLYMDPDRPLDENELNNFRPLVKKRKSGQPLQYITGQVSFMGLSLKVDERALIPRPETEEMTEEILDGFRDYEGVKVLDLGTGSGAIAIALARFLVEPNITAVDKSPEALELARENARRNDLEDEIEFRGSDWFSKVSGNYDVIVSNPPYVPSSKLKELKEEIKDHEPPEALDGGEEGTREIKNILDQVESHLSDNGTVFLEIGHDQGEEVKNYATAQSLSDVRLIEDSQGTERILCGSKGA
ncbi:MAG: peptide chain release factor N(5)-glutamine methyltransferase [Candidatus Bipolaricaulota bacterium]|nr:peptide chain release factor N(5)-glutamine methyltransferase [Candidatus Bipolaricaulota bacterium]